VFNSLLSFLHFFILSFLRRDSSLFPQRMVRGWVKVEVWGMDWWALRISIFFDNSNFLVDI